jgi:iron(III) transport system substrate-binding protein
MIAVMTMLFACSNDIEKQTIDQKEILKDEAILEQNTIVVYSGRGEALVGELFEKIEDELKLDIEVQYGSTPEMVTRLLTEASQSPADIIFAQDSGHLGALTKQGRLATLSPSLLENVDSRFQAKDGTWIGTSGRLRVLVYDSAKYTEDQLPTSLKDLADPKWKGALGWAPGNGSFQAHVSALRHLWGETETKEWLEGVIANEPKRFPKNSPQVKAANDGELGIGWVNHYYLHRLDPNGRTAVNYSFPDVDGGNILMLAGVGVRKDSPNTEAAEKIIEYLVSIEGQSHFTMNNFEYPTRPNVQTHPDVPDMNIETILHVPQEHLADVGPTRTLLKDLSLQ